LVSGVLTGGLTAQDGRRKITAIDELACINIDDQTIARLCGTDSWPVVHIHLFNVFSRGALRRILRPGRLSVCRKIY